MSTKTFSRYLFSSPLLAAVSYFAIMFIGGCYAKAKEKTKVLVSLTLESSHIPEDGCTAKVASSSVHY